MSVTSGRVTKDCLNIQYYVGLYSIGAVPGDYGFADRFTQSAVHPGEDVGVNNLTRLRVLLLAATLLLSNQLRALERNDFSITGLEAGAAGLAIFTEADRRASGYQDLAVNLEMTLKDRRGAQSRRQLKIRQLEMVETGDRLLVVFDSPKDIRGTALLSYSYKVEADDQWLFMPAIKRVKKITSRNRSGPFLSSEFAFEDLALQEVEKFTYRLIEHGTDEQGEFYLVERTPVDDYSGYSRQLVRLDTEELRIQRIDYFDRRERPLKTLTVSNYQLFEDQFWKPGEMLMENLQTGRSTRLTWQDYRFGLGLDADRDFSTNALRRVR